MKKQKIAWVLAATALGVTAAGAVTGDMMDALGRVAIGTGAIASALGVRRQAKMGRIDEEVMYALR